MAKKSKKEKKGKKLSYYMRKKLERQAAEKAKAEKKGKGKGSSKSSGGGSAKKRVSAALKNMDANYEEFNELGSKLSGKTKKKFKKALALHQEAYEGMKEIKALVVEEENESEEEE